MSIMNKLHNYKGNKFNIKVELNYQVERSLDGKREHKITISNMGKYYETGLVETRNLEETISSMTEDAEKWVDNQMKDVKTQEEVLLENLGFK